MEDYPDNPGWKGTQTSMDAAEEKKKTKMADYKLVFVALKANLEGLTPDEIAAMYGERYMKFRPRCSELKKRGFVEPTGERRPSYLGTQQDVVRLSSRILLSSSHLRLIESYVWLK